LRRYDMSGCSTTCYETKSTLALQGMHVLGDLDSALVHAGAATCLARAVSWQSQVSHNAAGSFGAQCGQASTGSVPLEDDDSTLFTSAQSLSRTGSTSCVPRLGFQTQSSNSSAHHGPETVTTGADQIQAFGFCQPDSKGTGGESIPAWKRLVAVASVEVEKSSVAFRIGPRDEVSVQLDGSCRKAGRSVRLDLLVVSMNGKAICDAHTIDIAVHVAQKLVSSKDGIAAQVRTLRDSAMCKIFCLPFYSSMPTIFLCS
jgi:hypothetical protein